MVFTTEATEFTEEMILYLCVLCAFVENNDFRSKAVILHPHKI